MLIIYQKQLQEPGNNVLMFLGKEGCLESNEGGS